MLALKKVKGGMEAGKRGRGEEGNFGTLELWNPGTLEPLILNSLKIIIFGNPFKTSPALWNTKY
jgi:hypothetical protein